MIRARQLLRDVLRIRPFAKVVRMRNQRPMISFTFDDFPHSAVSIGAKILEKYHARGTFYASGSFCGQAVDGIPQFCVQDLADLAGSCHEIGCHTFHHRRVSGLTKSMLIKDTNLNATFIARHLPHATMRTFAYPFGDMSLQAKFKLERMFAGCRSTEFGINKDIAELGRLLAIRLYSNLLKPERIARLIYEAACPNSWLIFYTHDVSQQPSKYGCTPALLEYAVARAVSLGLEILPVSCAIKALHDESAATIHNEHTPLQTRNEASN
jgi:peptidoglycan/xylan/chitin deacetylase (PgdA/CDA1 family)